LFLLILFLSFSSSRQVCRGAVAIILQAPREFDFLSALFSTFRRKVCLSLFTTVLDSIETVHLNMEI
tara:strand:- start:1114 stop:1314 length:201 start_codon:yes stop_codon:yes gene_type:complete